MTPLCVQWLRAGQLVLALVLAVLILCVLLIAILCILLTLVLCLLILVLVLILILVLIQIVLISHEILLFSAQGSPALPYRTCLVRQAGCKSSGMTQWYNFCAAIVCSKCLRLCVNLA